MIWFFLEEVESLIARRAHLPSRTHKEAEQQVDSLCPFSTKVNLMLVLDWSLFIFFNDVCFCFSGTQQSHYITEYISDIGQNNCGLNPMQRTALTLSPGTCPTTSLVKKGYQRPKRIRKHRTTTAQRGEAELEVRCKPSCRGSSRSEQAGHGDLNGSPVGELRLHARERIRWTISHGGLALTSADSAGVVSWAWLLLPVWINANLLNYVTVRSNVRPRARKHGYWDFSCSAIASPQFPTMLTGPSLHRNTLRLPFEKRNKVCFQLEGHYTLNMHPVRCETPPECLAMGGGSPEV